MDDYISANHSHDESPLAKRKRLIVARSMAAIDKHIDKVFEHAVLAEKVAGRRRAVKRQRESSGGSDDECCPSDERGVVRSKQKKRFKYEDASETTPSTARRFACPFCKHDPKKYKNVKTCCGPGWPDVHRVK